MISILLSNLLNAYAAQAKYASNAPEGSRTVSNTPDGNNKKIGIYEELGEIANINAIFTDTSNNTKSIKEFMNGKSTIISMNYYNCPGICSTQFAAVANVIDLLDANIKNFQVLTISIEPTDTPKIALEKKNTFYQSLILKPNFPIDQWKFLSGNADNIKKFSDSIGYQYKKIVDKNGIVDYIHPGSLIVLSPTGKITRYVYGIRYSPFDVKMALIEADEERVGGIRVQALKYCFAYDAESKKYIFQWEKIVGGLMFAIVISFFLYLAFTGRKKD